LDFSPISQARSIAHSDIRRDFYTSVTLSRLLHLKYVFPVI
jgi:hypothetical protein